jgi:hypothetical protein
MATLGVCRSRIAPVSPSCSLTWRAYRLDDVALLELPSRALRARSRERGLGHFGDGASLVRRYASCQDGMGLYPRSTAYSVGTAQSSSRSATPPTRCPRCSASASTTASRTPSPLAKAIADDPATGTAPIDKSPGCSSGRRPEPGQEGIETGQLDRDDGPDPVWRSPGRRRSGRTWPRPRGWAGPGAGAAAAFLLGPDAGFITGTDLLMDGGVIAALRAGRWQLTI